MISRDVHDSSLVKAGPETQPQYCQAFAVAGRETLGDNRPVIRERGAKNITRIREALGWSQYELAKRSGNNFDTVQRIEAGENATLDRIIKITDALGIPLQRIFDENIDDLIDQLARGVVQSNAEVDPTPVPPTTRWIPVIAEGDASPDGLRWTNQIVRDHVVEWIPKPSGDWDDPDAFGILVLGDSMLPLFRKGQRVIVSPRAAVEDGSLVYAELGDGRRLIKIAYQDNGGWRLESLNQKYSPEIVSAAGMLKIHAIASASFLKPGQRPVPSPHQSSENQLHPVNDGMDQGKASDGIDQSPPPDDDSAIRPSRKRRP